MKIVVPPAALQRGTLKGGLLIVGAHMHRAIVHARSYATDSLLSCKPLISHESKIVSQHLPFVSHISR